jgi:hypothetical protein
MAFGIKLFTHKIGICPYDVSYRRTVGKRSCGIIYDALVGKCGKLHIGIDALKEVRKPGIRLESQATVGKADAFPLVDKNVLLEHSDFMYLLILKIVYCTVSVIEKHLGENAEEGEAVIPIAVSLGAASVLLKAAKIIIRYLHHSRQLRAYLFLFCKIKIRAKHTCDTDCRPIIRAGEPIIFTVSTVAEGLYYAISDLRFGTLGNKLGKLIAYEVDNL